LLVDRDETRRRLVAVVIRNAGDLMQRQGHHEACQVLDEALDEADRRIVDMFAE